MEMGNVLFRDRVERAPFQPRWLDRYYLCEELATGGMATVYGALYVGPGGFQKPCAVKVMHPHLTHDEGFVQMFEDEARVAACIDHPYVCRVTDYGVLGGETFLVMELLDGQNFWTIYQRLQARSDLKQESGFPMIMARLGLDAAEGLHAAHEARGLDGSLLQVVHRDISLSNLFLTRSGTVRVVDFGVVKSVARLHHTATGCFKGKLAYLAPEYVRSGQLDRRSDVFALGVVLREMLSGRRLHTGQNEVEVFRSVMSSKSTPLRELCPSLPSGLSEVVDRAMAYDPEERYPSARALADALGQFLVSCGRIVMPGEVSDWFDRLSPPGHSPVRQLLAQGSQRALLLSSAMARGSFRASPPVAGAR
ncbi:MAG: serine/threonine protein kinase, partial [Myxococcales bacterium]